MSSFRHAISTAVKRESEAASSLNNAAREFEHFERTRVLGQISTSLRLVTPLRIAQWVVRNRRLGKLIEQLTRMARASLATPLRLAPMGNTGGANMSPFKPMPLSADFAAEIESARRGA